LAQIYSLHLEIISHLRYCSEHVLTPYLFAISLPSFFLFNAYHCISGIGHRVLKRLGQGVAIVRQAAANF